MFVYVSMIALTCLLAGHAERAYRKSVRKTAFSCRPALNVSLWALIAAAAVIPSVLVGGLRFEVGTDYLVYLRENHIIGSVFAGKPIDTEPLYRVIVEIGYFFRSEQLVFFITALLFSVFIFRFIFDQSQDWVLSVILLLLTGVFNQSLNLMRQMVAVAIGMYAAKYALRKELFKYFLFVGIAVMIHKMALLFLPFYFVVDWKFITKKRIAVGLIIICVAGTALYGLVGRLLAAVGSSYVKYFGSSRDTGASTVLTILFGGAFTFCFFGCKDDDRGSLLYLLYQALACVMLVIQLPNANRLAYIFAPVQIVLIPNVVKGIKDRGWRTIAKIGIVAVYSVFYLYYFYWLNIGETFPYQSVLG